MADKAVSVAQVEVTGFQELPDRKASLLQALDARREREGLALICLMVTDVITIQSRLLCRGDQALLADLPFARVDGAEFDLGGIVSRKKQLVPALQAHWRNWNRSGKPHGTVTGQKTVRTVAIHLAIITIGFFLISAALRVRFDLRLYLYLVCISVARDAWETWR